MAVAIISRDCIYCMIIIMGILFVSVDTACTAVAAFSLVNTCSCKSDQYVGIHDPLFVATTLDRSDMFLDALQW